MKYSHAINLILWHIKNLFAWFLFCLHDKIHVFAMTCISIDVSDLKCCLYHDHSSSLTCSRIAVHRFSWDKILYYMNDVVYHQSLLDARKIYTLNIFEKLQFYSILSKITTWIRNWLKHSMTRHMNRDEFQLLIGVERDAK